MSGIKRIKKVLSVYRFTRNFPASETYGLSSQLRRAAVSVPANIAEGFKRRTLADIVRFLNIAQGSLEECRYYLILAKDLDYGDSTGLMLHLEEVSKKGIDWQTFLTAFQELQIECESGELSVQAIEKKRDGAFVIRVDAPAGANKETIEASFWSKYKPFLEANDEKIKLLSEQKEFYSQEAESKTLSWHLRRFCSNGAVGECDSPTVSIAVSTPI